MATEADRSIIERSVIEAIEGLVDRDVVIGSTTTFAELGLDSLGLVELALTLEQVWPIELRANEYDRIKTVGDMLAILDRQLR